MPVESWPPEFTIDRERILELLTGDRFYSNPSAALREAVLNAMDAIGRRRQREPALESRIDLVLDRTNLTMTIEDSGEGMSQAHVGDFFTRIGASAASVTPNSSPVGEFGIGVVSYFMAGDRFLLQTHDGRTEPLGLSFDRSILAGGRACTVPPTQSRQGTTVTIHIRDEDTFDTLVEQFPHWCRHVEGLSARLLPANTSLAQGGRELNSNPVSVPCPHWVEASHLCPVSDLDGWTSMTHASTISVLYRGVFVQEFEAEQLWGMQGSIDVNPKHFKPRLNREGFVGKNFELGVRQFLESSHPAVLKSMADRLKEAHEKGRLVGWTARHWASLWLAVPRTEPYAETLQSWDSVFRTLPAFEVANRNAWRPASLDDIIRLKPDVFLAPLPEQKPSELANAAVRVLRNTGRSVIRGIKYDRQWMRQLSRSFGTTAELIAQVFQAEMPHLVDVNSKAVDIVNSIRPVTSLFSGPPSVQLVRLGTDNPPALRVASNLLINIDEARGRQLVLDALATNIGPISLVSSAALHAHEQLSQVAAVVRQIGNTSSIDQGLSPLRRRYIRYLIA